MRSARPRWWASRSTRCCTRSRRASRTRSARSRCSRIWESSTSARPAELDEADRLHGPGSVDVETGKQLAKPSVKWTHVFAEELVHIADERPDIVGITAAMAEPTGIAALARKYPDRTY